MSNMSLHKYELQPEDEYGSAITTGITYTPLDAGTADEATVYSDRAETAKTVPVTSTVYGTDGGKIIFYSSASSIDLTVVTAAGGAIYKRGITPDEGRLIIRQDPGNHHTMMVPFNGADIAGQAETDLGYNLPIGAEINGANPPWIWVDTAFSSATGSVNVGLLSTESGGDVNGLLAAVSLSVVGRVNGYTDAAASAGGVKLGALIANIVPAGSVDANVAYLNYLAESGAARSVVMSADTAASGCAGLIAIKYLQTGVRLAT